MFSFGMITVKINHISSCLNMRATKINSWVNLVDVDFHPADITGTGKVTEQRSTFDMQLIAMKGQNKLDFHFN